MKILVGTDFSSEADVALAHAAVLAKSTEGSVSLVNCTSLPITADGSLPEEIHGAMRETVDAHKSELLRKLDDQANWLVDDGGVAVETRVVDDAPSRSLPEVATTMGASLVVVGSHGRTGLRRFLLGSVAEGVVRHSPVNVLVARGAAPKDGYQSILVPIDFSPTSIQALELAISLCEPGGRVDVIHCWDLPVTPLEAWATQRGQLESSLVLAMGAKGEQLLKDHTREGISINFTMEQGDPRRCVERRLEERPYDLVVVGSHGRTGGQRLLLGSVAESIVRHSTSSVIVTKG